MDIRFDDRGEFARLAAKFKAAGDRGAAIRKALTKQIQTDLKLVVADVRRDVQALNVRGVKGRGAQRRELFYKAHRPRGRSRSHGLRASVERATKSRVQYTGYRLGAKVYVDPASMPQSQRRLPRHLNRPEGWRHPVWGHRDRKWAQQIGGPYFDNAIRHHRDRVRRNVAKAVNDVMRKLR